MAVRFLPTVAIVVAVYSGLLLVAPPTYTTHVDLTCDGGDTVDGTFQSMDECTLAMGDRSCACVLRMHASYYSFYLLLLPLALAGAAISTGGAASAQRSRR